MSQKPEHDEELLYEKPVLVIKRWNRCLWILVVTLGWTALMFGLMIPGISRLKSDNGGDFLMYLSAIAFIFAGLFFTFWYICQYETNDITHFERIISDNRIKRIDDDRRHSRPKSLRSPLTSNSSNILDEEISRASLIEKGPRNTVEL